MLQVLIEFHMNLDLDARVGRQPIENLSPVVAGILALIVGINIVKFADSVFLSETWIDPAAVQIGDRDIIRFNPCTGAYHVSNGFHLRFIKVLTPQ